jgi:hypothetical protein
MTEIDTEPGSEELRRREPHRGRCTDPVVRVGFTILGLGVPVERMERSGSARRFEARDADANQTRQGIRGVAELNLSVGRFCAIDGGCRRHLRVSRKTLRHANRNE